MNDKDSKIRFTFDEDKFYAVMLILAKKTSRLDALKAAKLLYLADRDHLRAHGKPILGDSYVAMEYGPVPSLSYDILKNIRSGIVTNALLRVERQSGHQYPVFVAIVEPELDYLSQTEMESIDKIIDEYGNNLGTDLVNITHKHKTWTESKENLLEGADPIDYRLFFSEQSEDCQQAFDVMIMEQEDRDFATGL
ncbi:MAG: Panacea domain-containing protein [candidate division Zixibacteria bacterium]|nr:Panacea domain-containing protein [candidate division Zixibacteria bacterium]